MGEQELIHKACELYLNSDKTLDQQAKELHIGKIKYKKILKDNFHYEEVTTRQEAWNLYTRYPDELKFYRVIGETSKSGKIYLLGIIVSNDELQELVEVTGMSAKKIAEMVNMPFVTESFIHDRTNRLKFKYSKEAIKSNRLAGLKETLDDPEKLDLINHKRRATMVGRYGADSPMRVDSIKSRQRRTVMNKYGVPVSTMSKDVQKKQQKTSLKNNGVPFPAQNKDIYAKVVNTNKERYGASSFMISDKGREISKITMLSRYGYEHALSSPLLRAKAIKTRHDNPANIEFTPGLYIENAVVSKDVTQNKDTLYDFLHSVFPTKSTFTLAEISYATGRSANFIKSRFHTDGSVIVNSRQGRVHYLMQSYLESLGYKSGVDFIMNDRQAIKPLEIDFYFPKQKVGIEVNDLATHNVTTNIFGNNPKSKEYHKEKSDRCREAGIRLIHAWEQYFNNPQQYAILKNAIKHALGITANRVYARNTYVKEVSNTGLRNFFNTNNIQGFRGANRAYALLDKKTDEVLMAYSVGRSHFSHNKYDLEIIRGASKLDTTIVGGASKLWKYIIDNNPEVNSIVYYIDRNIYSGSSLWSLEGNLELVSSQVGFWNYFVDEDEIRNRQPSKHKEIKELVSQGKVWEVYNAGTDTYVWTR